MKKSIFFLFAGFLVVASLQNCKPEKYVTPPPSDPDSLYAGTHYSLLDSVQPRLFRFPSVTNPYKDSMTREGVELGRRLFYDKHLSLDGQKSCGSCHKLQYGLSDAGNILSSNEFGLTKRNAPALQNLAWATQIFWDGRAATLAAQAQDAYQHELGLNVATSITYLQADSNYIRLFKKAFGRPGDITTDKIYKAVEQFMFTAISGNSKFDRVMEGLGMFTTSEQNGFDMFRTERGDCFHCHTSGSSNLMMNDNRYHNNGLDAANTVSDFHDMGRGGVTAVSADYGTFKVPSLRNIALSAPYMHDGRFATLNQVIDFYSDSLKISPNLDPIMRLYGRDTMGGMKFTPEEKQNMLDFLNTLTDTSFINNPNLKDPF